METQYLLGHSGFKSSILPCLGILLWHKMQCCGMLTALRGAQSRKAHDVDLGCGASSFATWAIKHKRLNIGSIYSGKICHVVLWQISSENHNRDF